MNKKYHMKQEIIDRLEYKEETYAGEIETWRDPVTEAYYHIPIEIVRDWDNSELLESNKQNTMTHERKEQHIRNIAFCINDGAHGYVTDNFRIEDLPTPQRTGTMTQQDTYSKHKARQIFEAFLDQNPNIND
tara:strand:- start:1033 stop:1428 length:396 start_codon:yes stop_codon:yes gene_type:complete